MTILRWMILAALAVAFLLMSVANWVPVPFRLPDGAVISAPLPLLLGASFILGWLPTWLLHLGTRTTLKRRLAKIERSSDDKLPTPAPFVPPTPSAPLAPDAPPISAPPAGA